MAHKEEVKKVSAVLEDTRLSLESVKMVRYYLSYIKSLHHLFSCSLAPTEGTAQRSLLWVSKEKHDGKNHFLLETGDPLQFFSFVNKLIQ